MRKLSTFGLALLICSVTLMAQVGPGNRGRIGVGYDEGLAGRFFFTDKIGAQLSVGMSHIGGYDITFTNGQATQFALSQTDFSIAGAFVYNFFGSEWVYIDGLGQLAYAFDDAPDAGDLNDRNLFFFRIAGAPEILIGDHLGLGFRFGFELVAVGDVQTSDVRTQESHADVRFFGPSNPFAGPVLGMSLYVYFGQF